MNEQTNEATGSLRVRAKRLGFYGGSRRRPGDMFTLAGPKDFSSKWMERVVAPTPTAQPTDDEERLVATSRVYEYFSKRLNISPRTLQWYGTEGLIPMPTRKGRDAFYDPAESQIYALVHVIHELEKNFSYRLWQIKGLLEKYRGQDLSKLQLLLENLRTKYPAYTQGSDGIPEENRHNELVRDLFLSRLLKGTPVDKLSLFDVERDVDKAERIATKTGVKTNDGVPF